jgi:hypothetical protein
MPNLLSVGKAKVPYGNIILKIKTIISENKQLVTIDLKTLLPLPATCMTNNAFVRGLA